MKRLPFFLVMLALGGCSSYQNGSKNRLMNDKILKKYLEYTDSEEAFAVLFVKKYLAQTKGRWVDIGDVNGNVKMTPLGNPILTPLGLHSAI